MKSFIKFKRHFIVAAALGCTLMLGGAKAWQDPAALPAALDCGQKICCERCLVTHSSLTPDRTAGWEWKLRFAGHVSR